MKLILLGAPGAGKGTVAKLLTAIDGSVQISTGDILRGAVQAGTDLGKEAEGFMKRGDLVPDSLIMGIMEKRLQEPDCAKGFLLDGFPRTIAQAEALDAMLAEKNTPLHIVLELQVPEEELFNRLAGRGRADDTPDVIKQRLVAYRQQTEPLLQYYAKSELLKSIDGLGTIEEISDRAKAALEQLNN